MRLKEKVAIITGGSRGIGRAIALGFAAQGASVVVAARTKQDLSEVTNCIKDSGKECLGISCDITDESQVADLVTETVDRFKRIDVLVNNAGIGGMRPVHAVPLESFEKIVKVNLTGTFLCTKHVWLPMKNSGGGSIINISSLGGVTAYPLLTAYCASKWGQIGFTKACAEEGKRDNIRVNAVAPGKGNTAIRSMIKEDKSKMLNPEDHVNVSIFLASDESKYITGQVISLDWFGPDL
jgi:3-oxoacyl-[acyl-carrier protein] reductase